MVFDEVVHLDFNAVLIRLQMHACCFIFNILYQTSPNIIRKENDFIHLGLVARRRNNVDQCMHQNII
jgi:hypothetical protein